MPMNIVLKYDSLGVRKRIAVSQCNNFTCLHSVCGGSITQRHKPRDRLRRSQAAGIRLARCLTQPPTLRSTAFAGPAASPKLIQRKDAQSSWTRVALTYLALGEISGPWPNVENATTGACFSRGNKAEMVTTEASPYRGYKIVLMRKWSHWCAEVYPTRADLPILPRSTLSAPMKEDAVAEAKKTIDHLLSPGN